MSRLPGEEDRPDRLPIRRVPPGSRWLRITQTRHPTPLYFNRQPGGRFNPASGSFGTLYCAADLTGALAESVCRGAAARRLETRISTEADLRVLGIYTIAVARELCLVDFSIPHLAAYGLDARIYAEYDDQAKGYHFGPTWADHLCGQGFDGILYPSRHHTRSICLALFSPSMGSEEQNVLSYTLASTVMDDERALEILEEVFNWAIL